MSGTTANRAYPYPQTSDSYTPSADMQALAEAIDGDVDAVDHRTVGTPVQATSGLSASGSTTNVQIDTITVPVVSGERYKILARIPWVGNTLNDDFFLLILEDTTSGTQLDFETVRVLETTRTRCANPWALWTAGSTGNKTFVTAFRRAAGSGTITIGGASTGKRYLKVEKDF